WSYDDCGSRRRGDARRSPELDAVVAARADWSQVYQHHPVVLQIQDRPQVFLQALPLSRRQLAAENRELQRIAVPAHLLVYLPQPLGIGDVVGDQVNVSHLSELPASFQWFAPPARLCRRSAAAIWCKNSDIPSALPAERATAAAPELPKSAGNTPCIQK